MCMRKAEEKSYGAVFVATKIPKWSQTLLRNGISQATKYIEIEMMNVETQSVSRLWSNFKRKARRRHPSARKTKGLAKPFLQPLHGCARCKRIVGKI
jgi:hypothetical protein